ncbi:iron-sulfur cluster co-chaperone, mitochondrial [Pelobates cultripes]|uniref:Iron-sulfur cluster co-chaperone protein HscB n=1 Tax=Pelobates cultripes TaxID=61616 RepID=A0AAD1SBY0_PELCU|nr:iron-sulfur cluster co-chaperone, mitochondrial [Pelobates cultripes]
MLGASPMAAMEPARRLLIKFVSMERLGRALTDSLSQRWTRPPGCRAMCVSPSPACVGARLCVSMRTNMQPLRAWIEGSDSNHHHYTRTFSLSAQGRLCWSCQAALAMDELFCPTCHSLQPPDETKDYFQVLDCEKTFDVNIQELQKKYRNLQRFLHPDYFSQKSHMEREMSEKQSSLVNKAYNTLLSPLSRGIYLLSLSGITLEEGTDSDVDPHFLLEILEISEQLNDCNISSEIEDIGNFVQEKYDSLTADVRNAFQQGDLHGAKLLLAKMKYFSNIQNQVKKKILP